MELNSFSCIWLFVISYGLVKGILLDLFGVIFIVFLESNFVLFDTKLESWWNI